MLVLHGLVDRLWWFRRTAAFVFCSDSSTLTVEWWVLPASSCQRQHSATGNCGLIVCVFVLILLLYLNSLVKGHYTTWHLCSCRYIYRVAKTDILLCHVCPAARLCGTAWLQQNRFLLNFISGTFIKIFEGKLDVCLSVHLAYA